MRPNIFRLRGEPARPATQAQSTRGEPRGTNFNLTTLSKCAMVAVIVLNLSACAELYDFEDFGSCHYTYHDGIRTKVCRDDSGEVFVHHRHRHHRRHHRGPHARVESNHQFNVNKF